MTPPALVLAGVRKRYGSLAAVDGLSLEVRAGEILGLLGPNGAGKTTTVGIATGLVAPDEGRVEIGGSGPPSSVAARRRLGVAPQSLALYESLTGRENLEFLASLHGLEGAPRRERVAVALAFVSLADRADDRVSSYSGGMKRRLNLAAAVVHDPEVVLLDEPTVGVDPQSRNLVFDNVLALRARGRAIVYTTHYMEEAERLCDRVAIVDHGRLLAEGTVAELVAAYGGPGALVAETAAGEVRLVTADPLDELNRLAAAGPVHSFHVEKARLEDVFLHLTGRSLRD
jgi:ABC-2 type transport system ATP-binding protein